MKSKILNLRSFLWHCVPYKIFVFNYYCLTSLIKDFETKNEGAPFASGENCCLQNLTTLDTIIFNQSI